ncbi:MAG: hypothetical protein Kow0027_17740 [Saprospiraceae bacterium]
MNAATQITTSQRFSPVRNAVILAAGKSQRFRENGEQLPKVLMKVGGLRLLERAILTLNKAGVEHFRISVGAYRDQIVPKMEALPRLKGLDIEYVVCEDYEKGNGVSFGAAAAGFDGPFLLAMSDHIFSVDTIENFVSKALQTPELPALACDPNLNDVFDMDDATKVKSKKGFIGNIGKEIDDYDLVDIGLFYFPEGYGKRVADKVAEGATSVSHIVQHFIDDSGVRAIRLQKPFWQDVDNPDMKAEAERRLMQTLCRPGDGWVSRNFNRFFSTRLSMLLANWGLHPNWLTTITLVLSLVGAWFAGTANYPLIVLGAFLFQVASILDGSDGELARLTLRTSRFGEWYAELAGHFRYFFFFGALGVSAWKATGSKVYLFALIILAALGIYMLGQMMAFGMARERTANDLTSRRKMPLRNRVPRWAFGLVQQLSKRDVLAFVAFILTAAFLSEAMFWVALIGITFNAIWVSRSIRAATLAEKGASLFARIDPIVFYLLGVVILTLLIMKMDVGVVTQSLSAVGNQVFLVFSIAILWILANTMCIRTLVRGKVPFHDLLYNQMVGDAYGNIIPAAGLGGEPFKIKHLTNWLDWQTASRAVVTDRFIHAITGMLFSSVMVSLTLIFVPVDAVYRVPLTVLAIVFGVAAIGIIALALTSAPSKIAGFFLKKLQIVEDFRNEPTPPGRFFLAFLFKFTGRVFNLLEIYAIFYLLGFHPSVIELVAVAGLIAASATLFVIIPQGIGVNEAGISTALDFLGYSTSLGLTFGLIRRARMIFWALFGIGMHLAVTMVRRFAFSRTSS